MSVVVKSGGPGSAGTVAQAADGTAAGGNARGAGAVDWQTTRNTPAQVASGAGAVIAGGDRNTASGTRAGVLSGQGNIAGGGESAVVGGISNNAGGQWSTIGAGTDNIASGQASWIPGGRSANARGQIGRGAWASGHFAAAGDAQAGEALLRRTTADATAVNPTADGGAPGAANQLALADNSALLARVMVVAREAATGAAAGWVMECLLRRGAGVASTTVLPATGWTAPSWNDAGAANWRVALNADTANGALSVGVQGEAGKSIKWVVRAASIEVAG